MDDISAELEPRFRLKERIDALTAQIKALRPPKVAAASSPDRYLASLVKALGRAEKAAAKLAATMPGIKRRKKRATKV